MARVEQKAQEYGFALLGRKLRAESQGYDGKGLIEKCET
jgi:hypothetical protein